MVTDIGVGGPGFDYRADQKSDTVSNGSPALHVSVLSDTELRRWAPQLVTRFAAGIMKI